MSVTSFYEKRRKQVEESIRGSWHGGSSQENIDLPEPEYPPISRASEVPLELIRQKVSVMRLEDIIVRQRCNRFA